MLKRHKATLFLSKLYLHYANKWTNLQKQIKINNNKQKLSE